MFSIEEKSQNKLLIAGTQLEITESLADYSASEYKLNYIFKKSTNPISEFETIADGSDHLLVISAEDSSTEFGAGGYYHCIIQAINLSDATEIIPIASLVVMFVGDASTVNDVRSFELKMVEKLETALLALADKTMSSISIDGRSYTYHDIASLESSRDYYKNKAGIKTETSGRKRILYKFTNE